MTHETPFWQHKSLAEMTRAEWESVCDGCGKCCLLKFQDEETGRIDFTDIACRLLDTESCRCRDYKNRKKLVSDCVRLTKDNIAEFAWMPSTCAYRLLAEGKPLYWWHPLVSGDPGSVHEAGISVSGRVVSETRVPDDKMLQHIVTWPA